MTVSATDIFHARNIALIGATENSHWPKNIYENLVRSGFDGNVWPINPKRETIFDVPCYPDLMSTPETADLALIIIPADSVLETLELGVRTGMKSAVIYSSGFGEGTTFESIKRGERLKSKLKTLSLPICGPNCMGLVATREKLYCYPHTSISNLKPGPTAFITQSGGTLSYFFRAGGDRGLTFSYGISSGNELGLDMSDYINFCVDDPHTQQICLFIEGIRNPPNFMAACGRALEAEKPIIALKTGRSQKSREAARSHSGAISGDYTAYEAVCDRYGIVNCETLEEMVEMAVAFRQGRWPEGPRVAFMTTSGGTVDLLHDYCDEQGASVPELSPKTVDAIRPYVPKHCDIRNPIDTGAPVGKSGKSSPIEICKAFAQDQNVDIVAWCNNLPGSARTSGASQEIKKLLDSTTKPVFSFARIPHQMPKGGIEFQQEIGMPFIQGTRAAVRVANALWHFSEKRGNYPAVPGYPEGSAINCSNNKLTESLDSIGIQAPKSDFGATPSEAAKAASKIGFPVALKIVSSQIYHKTEVSGVVLNLTSQKAVESAALDLLGKVKKRNEHVQIDRFLIQEMVEGVEVLIGVRADPLYGPLLVIGSGGTLVELISDIAVALLPVTEGQIRNLIDGLKLKHQLAGWRGAEKADTEALVEATLALSDFFLNHRPWLDDLEINPLVVLQEGEGVRAVDIRTIKKE